MHLNDKTFAWAQQKHEPYIWHQSDGKYFPRALLIYTYWKVLVARMSPIWHCITQSHFKFWKRPPRPTHTCVLYGYVVVTHRKCIYWLWNIFPPQLHMTTLGYEYRPHSIALCSGGCCWHLNTSVWWWKIWGWDILPRCFKYF